MRKPFKYSRFFQDDFELSRRETFLEFMMKEIEYAMFRKKKCSRTNDATRNVDKPFKSRDLVILAPMKETKDSV